MSTDLLSDQEFLLQFDPTREVDTDITALLEGLGQTHVLKLCHQYNVSLRGLGTQIRRNHRQELARLNQGQSPRFSDHRHWSSEQLLVYHYRLALEENVLTSILQFSDKELVS